MENIFKDRLKYLRQEKEIGQEELAAGIKLSHGVISLWEKGLREPKMSSLMALSKFFGVSIDYLVGLKDE